MSHIQTLHIATDLLDILPNPVLVKNQDLEYIWINKAFEELFSVTREQVVGRLDAELFPNRQVSQCNGGDLRVLGNGVIDEAVETVYTKTGLERETITRKSRLEVGEDEVYLVGVMHDITDVVRANEALTRSQVKLERQAAELTRLATTDALTGCFNRRALQICEQQLLRDVRQTAAILVLDIDNFKAINDQHGHESGDQVLRHFAEVVRSLLQEQDYFVRLGGEEFAVSLSSVTGTQAEEKANSIRRKVETSAIPVGGVELNVTVSIGVSCKAMGQSVSIDEMLRIADDNLYSAKAGGRNQVVLAA